MKLRPITDIDKRNKVMLKKFDNDVMAANCDVIVIFPIYDQFRASGNCIPVGESVKLTFPLRITLYLTKSENIKTELKNL